MSDFIPNVFLASKSKNNRKIKNVTIDLQRGDVMHVTFKIGRKIILKVEATPGNMIIEREFDNHIRREINFYTKTIT